MTDFAKQFLDENAEVDFSCMDDIDLLKIYTKWLLEDNVPSRFTTCAKCGTEGATYRVSPMGKNYIGQCLPCCKADGKTPDEDVTELVKVIEHDD